jgi:uncharacterized membrane protein
MEIVRNFFITFAVFMGIDLVWLGLVARKFYQQQLGSLMRSQTNWPVAIAFYAIYNFALYLVVIRPALDRGSWQTALLHGLAYGLITYMTYDLTNLSTLKDWPVLLTVVDILWGTALAGTVAFLSYTIIRLF